MGERKPIQINTEHGTLHLSPENCGIALFRLEPDKDYLDVWTPELEDPERQHWWIFNQREKLIWMGGVALQRGDDKILRMANRTLGSFAEHSGGWRPQVLIEDKASEWEDELYIRYLTDGVLDNDEHLHKDLNKALKEDFSE